MAKASVKTPKKTVEADGENYLELLKSADCLQGAVAVRTNGDLRDLSEPVTDGNLVEPIRASSPEGLEIIRHSTSHIMAEALGHIRKSVRYDIGPAIEDGFYYDFDLETELGAGDLDELSAEMKAIIKKAEPFKRIDVARNDAIAIMKERGQDYKAARLEQDIDADTVSLYKHGDFIDLCLGPHVPSMKFLGDFKLLSVAGSYWRGNENNPMLLRVYGTAFADRKALKEHLRLLEEARKRDHRKLGRELDLFSFHEEAPGFAFWHPRGTVLFNEIIDHWRKIHRIAGYKETKTPIILSDELWHRSGHWDNYRDNMYFTNIDEMSAAIKPMNCPGTLLIYKNRMWSYRELPLKMGEIGLVHRHEKSGVLAGLLRVRAFHQDDAHVFCTPEQVEEEVIKIIDLVLKIYSDFGFSNVKLELSTRPEKSIGSDENWENAENALKKALEHSSIEYELNPGDGAFYGPKIDFHIKDALKRSWQCGTIQVDFSMPERFALEYIGPDGAKHTPVMIHRALLGSIERFIAILLENTGGALPAWLSPVQVKILPVSEKHLEYASQIMQNLMNVGMRAELDDRNERIGQKIRLATLEKIPFMLILGAAEIEQNTVSVRTRAEGDIGARSFNEFVKLAQDCIAAKK